MQQANLICKNRQQTLKNFKGKNTPQRRYYYLNEYIYGIINHKKIVKQMINVY